MTKKRIIIAVLLLALSVTLAFGAAACGETPDDGSPELESISVSGSYKTVYTEGESFEKSKLIVKATYDDGTSAEIKDYTLTPSGALKTSDKKVTISYGGLTKDISITVNKAEVTVTLTSIAVTTPPTKTVYTEGETFDKTGMVVTATYSDDSTAAVTDYTVDKTGALKTTDTEVTVTYQGKTAKVSITVNKAEVTENPESILIETAMGEAGDACYVTGTTTDGKKSVHMRAQDDPDHATLAGTTDGDYMMDFVIGAELNFAFDSAEDCTAAFVLRGSSTYVTKYGTVNTYWPAIVEAMQINRLFDMTVNGEPVTISDSLEFVGSPVEVTEGKIEYLSNWCEVRIEGINIREGANVITLTFKDNGYRNASSGASAGDMPSPFIDNATIEFDQ